jgi:alkanesulfonate monooxygenase SsuD/methylene tetrahydromethanopterin reductase-like flavin-dependent oxidoreductase (luciferase family)
MGQIEAGRKRSGHVGEPFDVAASVPVVVGDDVAACADRLRAYTALYLGGMGSREQNFYNQLACRMGFEDDARRVQDLYLDRRHREAMAAVPQEFIDQTALIGPKARIAERMHAFADAGVTTLTVLPFDDTLDLRISTVRAASDALEASGLSE